MGKKNNIIKGSSIYDSFILSREYLKQHNIDENELPIFYKIVDTEKEKKELVKKYDNQMAEKQYMGDCSAKWIVDIKGDGLEGDFEISIIRENNNFCKGKRGSWGWAGDTKIIISEFSSTYSSADKIHPIAWEKLKIIAKEICEEMNKKEGFK